MDRNLGNSTKIRDKTMLPTLTNLFNTEVEDVAGTVRKLKQIKWLQIGKKEVKVLLLTDDMIININNSKNSIREHLQLLNSQGVGYQKKGNHLKCK